jgi:hypothetical protein
MIGNDFLFGDHWLSDFDMGMFDPEDDQQFVSREIEKSDITAKRNKPYHYSTKYTDVLTLNFLIIKNTSIPNEAKLTGEDINLLRAWLESPKTPTQLVVPLETDEMTTNYYGVFTSIQPYLVHKECFGLYLTFTCDAPYGFSDIYTSVYKINGSNDDISSRFTNMSAEYTEYLKPKISIYSVSKFNEGESLVITNKSDNSNKMTIEMPVGISKLVIDCEKKIVTDGDGNLLKMSDIGLKLPISSEYNFMSAEQYIYYWLQLVPNENKLVFTGSFGNSILKVEIGARYIIKSGGF